MNPQCAVCGSFYDHESWCDYAPKMGTVANGIPSELRQADDAACNEQILGTPHNVQLIGKNQHSPFCVCAECVKPERLAAESEAEDAYNRDLRITKAIERAAITIAAAILKSADGHASSEWTHADPNVLYKKLADKLWNATEAE